ncbi:MAG TPA: alpha/beta hydrolase [Aestuariivirga sp.]|nr:alpha/beta hydrolase [Aestuariivirga sp.]
MRRLSVHGTALEISGSGPPVVLLHGVGLNQSIWAAQVKALVSDFQVISYDLLGHGRSAPARANAPLADWVDQLIGVVHDLALKKFALVGFSFGGMIAQAYAAQHSYMIDRLVLMSTVYDRSEAERASVRSRLDVARRKGPDAIISAALSRWFSPGFAKTHPEIIHQFKAILRGNDAASFLSAYECFAKADRELVRELAAFNRPSLIMTGELDTGSTPDMARILAGMIPRAECSIIAGGRHMMPVEMPDEVNSVLRQFLKKGSP